MYQNCKNYDPIVRCSCQLKFSDILYFSKSSNSSILKGIQQAILVHGQVAQKSFYQNYETHNLRFRYSRGMFQWDFNHQTSPFYHTYIHVHVAFTCILSLFCKTFCQTKCKIFKSKVIMSIFKQVGHHFIFIFIDSFFFIFDQRIHLVFKHHNSLVQFISYSK